MAYYSPSLLKKRRMGKNPRLAAALRLATLKPQRRRVGVRAAFDLFGEIAVTEAEVFAWCRALAGLAPDSPRLAWYVHAYAVVEKIQQAKAAGLFEQIIAARST